MNCKVLMLPISMLMFAVAPSTLALTAVSSASTARTAKTESALNNNVAQKICTDKDGNFYHCP